MAAGRQAPLGPVIMAPGGEAELCSRALLVPSGGEASGRRQAVFLSPFMEMERGWFGEAARPK